MLRRNYDLRKDRIPLVAIGAYEQSLRLGLFYKLAKVMLA